jgi:acyl CoA:acetate/3-ketoacid CoA transferase alpha subunit
MSEAVQKFVRDGDTVYMAGFTHLIPHSAARVAEVLCALEAGSHRLSIP